jgi:hypothetical protein
MIGKIAGALIGRRMAGRYGNGTRGALIGAIVPLVARRAFGPLGLVVAGGYAAKKIYDSQKGKRRRPVA